MATNSTTSICGICDFRQVTKPSVVWCSECDEGLCEDCTEHHSISKATREHSTVSIDKYKKLPPSILTITQTCKSHNEKFHIYCYKHDCPCCKKCIVETHNECKELSDIDDVVKDVKSSNAFVDIELTLAEISENLKRIRKDREENLTSIKETKEKIESEIKMTKLKIVSNLDKLQGKILKELNKTEKLESKQIHKLLTAVQQADKDVTEYQNNIANIKQHASDLQAFIALKQIEHDVDEKDKFIQTLVNSKDLNHAVLSWKSSTDMKNVNTSISTFGKIVVESKSSGITIARRKNQQAQNMVNNPVLRSVNTGAELKNSKQMRTNPGDCKQS
ncbi:transcription intermediary factor 1-beta-like [Mytilus californianus]|uniref:transcription intermediary factor 1-beta-like n=1 Tax=Mytilus californianus TaxID=6549 RepID=UPI0022459F66|nr:transcription intermediary factor 1-beta-like [Mytilus californianus]